MKCPYCSKEMEIGEVRVGEGMLNQLYIQMYNFISVKFKWL